MKADLYQILDIGHDASHETIVQLCEQCLVATPDHNTRVALRHARDVLCNPVSRAAYDARLRAQRVVHRVALPREAPEGIGGINKKLVGWGIFVCAFLLLGWGYAKKTGYELPPTKPVVQVRQVEPVQVLRVKNAPSAAAVGAGPESVYAAAAPSVTLVLSLNANGQTLASGSGIVIGLQRVITNCHVIQMAANVIVRYANTDYEATAGTSDTHYDLCVLEVSNLNAPEVARGRAQDLRVGQKVYAIGAPQGLDGTLSEGLISALRETPDHDGFVIQTSAPISPGSSGGGLFDSDGRLIGITPFQARSGQNLNFAVPVDWLDSMQTR